MPSWRWRRPGRQLQHRAESGRGCAAPARQGAEKGRGWPDHRAAERPAAGDLDQRGRYLTAFDPLVEIADPSQLEVASELGAEQMKQLAEGQPVEINTLSRPDVVMPSIIRLMPAPYGSGGSGAVQDRIAPPASNFSIPKARRSRPA